MLTNQIYKLLNVEHCKQTEALHQEHLRYQSKDDQILESVDLRYNKAKVAVLNRKIEELEAAGDFQGAKSLQADVRKLQEEINDIEVARPIVQIRSLQLEQKKKARELLTDALRQAQRFADETGCDLQLVALDRVVLK